MFHPKIKMFMNALSSKISTIVVVLLVCICNVLSVNANKSDEQFLQEAKFSKSGMRSIAIDKPVDVDIVGSSLVFTFHEKISQVIVNAKNESGKLVNFYFYQNPQSETFSMSNWKKGVYTVEIATESDVYTEYIYVH